MDSISWGEFEEKYMQPEKRWDFTKFLILCRKCNSNKVEYNNDMEFSHGWYDDIEPRGSIVVKCHDCGNAFSIDAYELLN